MNAVAPAGTGLIGDRLEHWAHHRPDAEALRYLAGTPEESRRWTWSQWRDRVHRASDALLAAGVRPGDRVAVLDQNHPACLEITFAAGAIGAATVIVNWRLAGPELDYVINDSGATVLLIGADLVPMLDAAADLRTVRQRIVVGGAADEYEAWLAAAEPAGPRAAVAESDVCLVMYSSGTTGRPKGVLLTHRNLAAHTLAVSDQFPFGDEDKNLVAMPLFHVGGTSYALLGVHAGAPTVLTRTPDAPSLLGALDAGATHAFLVPPVVAGILAAGDQAVAAFQRLRVLGYGAAPMPLPLLRSALTAFPDTDFVQVYGMTEVAGVISRLSAPDHRETGHPERLASAGTLIPGAELRVVDPATESDAPAGGIGELWFRTAQVMAGYLGRPEDTAAAITPDGWLRSGDIGRVDDDGYLYIVDRLKDMIITGGENVYSPEVERVIAEHPAVADVAVIGVPDDRWGESVKAIVTAVPDVRLLPGEVIAFCRDRLAHYKCPRTVDVVESLPRNPTGKIMKKVLRRQHWDGDDRQV